MRGDKPLPPCVSFPGVTKVVDSVAEYRYPVCVARDEKRKVDPSAIESPGGRLARSHPLTDRQAESMAGDLHARIQRGSQPQSPSEKEDVPAQDFE